MNGSADWRGVLRLSVTTHVCPLCKDCIVRDRHRAV